MSIKPYKNSKGVNKPFRSPFSTTPRNNAVKNNVNTPEPNTCETSLRVSISKRLLFESPPAKRLRLSIESYEDQASAEQSKELSRSHLESLRKRIREKQESINNLKTTLSYKKKNKAEDLETAIKKWTDICQIALKDYQKNLEERNGYCTNMTEILSSFDIDPSIVRFSTDDDTFC